MINRKIVTNRKLFVQRITLRMIDPLSAHCRRTRMSKVMYRVMSGWIIQSWTFAYIRLLNKGILNGDIRP